MSTMQNISEILLLIHPYEKNYVGSCIAYFIQSQGSLGPADSVSQVLPPYFCNNFPLDIEEENDNSAPSETLSSAPYGFPTATLDSN